MLEIKTKIHLVRHGYTPNNHAGYAGQDSRMYFPNDDSCPLEKHYGTAQVDELGEYLDSKLGEKVLFLISPYYRTKETLAHIEKKLKPRIIINRTVKSIREINQGLQYGYPKVKYDDVGSIPYENQEIEAYRELQKDYKSKGNDSEYVPYLFGESLSDVRRRVIHFAKELKELNESGEFTDIVVVSHNSVIKIIYELLTRKKLELKLLTASALTLENKEDEFVESELFAPNVIVPKDYVISYEEYKNYFMIQKMKNLIEEKDEMNDQTYKAFTGKRSLDANILEDECIFIQNPGEMLVIPPGNQKDEGFFFIDATQTESSLGFGQENITYDKKSTSTYHIMSGSGVFYLIPKSEVSDIDKIDLSSFKKFEVNSNDTNEIVVPNNTVFYYESNIDDPLVMIEKMTPNFEQENVVIIDKTPKAKMFEENDRITNSKIDSIKK